MKRRTGIYAWPPCKEHATGRGHPEAPERYDAVMTALRERQLVESLSAIGGRPATRQELALCHAPAYISLVEEEVSHGRSELSTGDTPLCNRSWDVATHTVGGVLNAVDAVASGFVDNAFCVVRPPGHHASADCGTGFCIFNNIALAARHAQKRHGFERILIVDWDVHHGNGTQDIFYRDGSVFFFSTHQWPWYPGTGSVGETGEGDGAGTTLNCPSPSGSGGREIIDAFERRLLPAMKEFRPNMVLISAGFDSRAGDPLGGFLLTDDDFGKLTQLILDIAESHAGDAWFPCSKADTAWRVWDSPRLPTFQSSRDQRDDCLYRETALTSEGFAPWHSPYEKPRNNLHRRAFTHFGEASQR